MQQPAHCCAFTPRKDQARYANKIGWEANLSPFDAERFQHVQVLSEITLDG
jgi:hypothetical protein